jgi:hypothetical protein
MPTCKPTGQLPNITAATKGGCFFNYERCSLINQVLGFALYRLSVRVSQTSGSLETHMVINFKAREISRGARKLARTPTLIEKIEKLVVFVMN